MVFYLGAASVGTFVDVTVGVQVIIGAVLGGRRTILGAVLGRGLPDRRRRDACGRSAISRPSSSRRSRSFVVLVFPAGLLGMVKGVREAT